MLTLRYNDLSDSCSLTSRTMVRHRRAITMLEKKLEREKDFEIALTDYLRYYGEISWDDYNDAVALFVHSDKTIEEIFEGIFEKRG